MIRHKRWAVAAASLVVLGVAGTATAASGADPSPGTTKAPTKVGGPSGCPVSDGTPLTSKDVVFSFLRQGRRPFL